MAHALSASIVELQDAYAEDVLEWAEDAERIARTLYGSRRTPER